MNAKDIAELERSARSASGLLKGIANQNRLLILCQLADGEKCVSELEAALGLRQPSLSQQLARLRDAGLVETRRASKNIYYSIAQSDVRAMLDVLCDLFGEHEDPSEELLAAE